MYTWGGWWVTYVRRWHTIVGDDIPNRDGILEIDNILVQGGWRHFAQDGCAPRGMATQGGWEHFCDL